MYWTDKFKNVNYSFLVKKVISGDQVCLNMKNMKNMKTEKYEKYEKYEK